MASSLRLIASNLVTRSTFRPTVFSAARFLSIDAGHRSYSTTPKADDFNQSSVAIACPKISSMRLRMLMDDKKRHLSLFIVGDRVTNIKIDKPAGLKMKDMRACTEHNTWFTQDIKQSTDKTSSDIKEDGMLEVEEDEFKSTSMILNNMANDIITSFHDITAKRSWSYYDMFSDRSILGKGLCRLIAMRSRIKSFTILKKEDAESVDIQMIIPGWAGMGLTMQGQLLVSWGLGDGDTYHLFANVELADGTFFFDYDTDRDLNEADNRQLEREDVTTFFDYDTFFIEAKNKNRHYITGIRLPEGIRMKNNMIKKRMEDGDFHAFLPCCGTMEELTLKLYNGHIDLCYY